MKDYLAELVRGSPSPLQARDNALQQTGWSGAHLTGQNWRAVQDDRLHRLEWQRVAEDVRPLLEPSAGTEMLTLENLRRFLAQRP